MPVKGKRRFNVDGANIDPASNGSVYDGPEPPARVPFRAKVKRLSLKLTNSKSNYMLNFVCEVNEPAKKNGKPNDKAQYNGAAMWGNLNITETGAPWVNQFLLALAGEDKAKKVISDFWAEKLRFDDAEAQQPMIRFIGTFKINEDGMPIIVQGKTEAGYGIKADRFLLDSNLVGSGADADEADEEDEEEEYAEEDEYSDEVDEEEEYAERHEELSEMSLMDLKKVAKGLDIPTPRGVKAEALVEAILGEEFPEDEEGDEEEEVAEEEELEEEEPEEEEEEEPEPPKRSRRTAAKPAPVSRKAAPAARGSRRSRKEPPF
jgi:hypothetical protein